MPAVQYVAVTNEVGADINFSIKWTNAQGQSNITSWNSGSYPVDKTRTSPDLATIGVPSDATTIEPQVHAVLGKTHDGSPSVTYASNGQTATYEAKGTVDFFSVKLITG